MKALADQLGHGVGLTSPLIYVAAPFAGNVPRNMEAALALARIVTYLGYIPVVPHAQGLLLGFGLAEFGVEFEHGEIKGFLTYVGHGKGEDRVVGLRYATELMTMIGKAGGQMVALLEDDGSTASRGMLSEVNLWPNVSANPVAFVTRSQLGGTCPHCGGARQVFCHPARLRMTTEGWAKCLACEHGDDVFEPCPRCGHGGRMEGGPPPEGTRE